jgi:hypothetical protein
MSDFIPAKNKLEAVARISFLTNSGPEELGPGSKERKSVLTNLANGLKIQIDESESKQGTASKIAKQLGVEWTAACESAGQTITLHGLNLLLKAATEILNQPQVISSADSLVDEVEKMSKVIDSHTPRLMDGVESITEMRNQEFKKWKLTEWQGMYFEFKVKPELIYSLGGGPRSIGRTEFDYALNYPWDMKVHSSISMNGKINSSGCQLNDGYSMELAAKECGIGLIILSGIPTYDLEFTKWFKTFRESKSKTPPKRLLKKQFESEKVDFYFIPNSDRFNEALAKKEISVFKQGRQQSRDMRNYKYSIDLKRATDSDLLIKTTVLT